MLHCAASKGRLPLVKWLLENVFKDNPSVKNDLGETPLHLAAGYFTQGIDYYISFELILGNVNYNVAPAQFSVLHFVFL